jgi:hypothetical protein
MNKKQLVPLTRKNLIPLMVIAGLAMVLISAGGFTFMAHQENNDAFCASCHTQPESTYYERSIAPAPVDLASIHRQKNTGCIDCHSGIGILGRISAQMMGAQNAMKWYSGTAVQPAPLIYPIGDEHCVKCHAEVLTEKHSGDPRTKDFGPKGHYHAYFNQWKGADQKAADCTSCHFGHELDGVSDKTWIVPAAVKPVCEACHQKLGTD